MNTVLMHTCCAPCSLSCIDPLRAEGLEPVAFWYNPNIHPWKEYQARRDCLLEYAPTIGMEVRVREDYGLREFVCHVADNIDGRCTYCYEHNKEAQAMTLETARAIVDREMTAEDGSDFVCLYYFGGEPYLQFETIRAIHSYMHAQQWNKGWFGFSTTNGTLVHGEIQDWLRENASSMEVYLSIDGDREMHNRNRSNSYDQIDVDFFRREYPFAKMTVTVETLPSTDEGVAWFVTAEGKFIFHAGDLNWWHWEGEDKAWNANMAADFKRYTEPLRGRCADLALLPLDPRLGVPYAYWGLLRFLELMDVRHLLPMHQWEQPEITDEFLRAYPQYAPITTVIRREGEIFELN